VDAVAEQSTWTRDMFRCFNARMILINFTPKKPPDLWLGGRCLKVNQHRESPRHRETTKYALLFISLSEERSRMLRSRARWDGPGARLPGWRRRARRPRAPWRASKTLVQAAASETKTVSLPAAKQEGCQAGTDV